MALTDEQKVLQADILASKTDSATNPNMSFKSNATLNKGLNPNYFSGNYTKIVNALNQLASGSENTKAGAEAVANKVNSILLDTDTVENETIWQAVQDLMDKPTIIEGLQNILEGNRQEQILGLSSDDIGKVLSVAQDENGNLVTKAIEAIAGGGNVSDITAEDVKYSNEAFSNFTNISDAMDFVLNNLGNGGSNNEDVTVNWNDIINKPDVPNNLVLTDNQLCLQSEQGIIASVEIVSDTDIDTMLNDL